MEAMSKPRVSILGLGIMGSGMAGRVLSADFPLTVYNRNREKTLPFESIGAFVANSPREAAARADIIISIVADDVASRDVWLGESGALAGAARDSVLVESSTLTVAWVMELAAAAAQHGCAFLDAPVTGTKPHAAAGELLFLVGGSASALATARPVLSVLSRDIVHLGPTGSGAYLKLINNYLCGVQAASLAEAIAFIARGGLDREKALAVLMSGAPASSLLKTICARFAAREVTTNFELRLMAKDLRYAVEEAARSGLSLQTARAAHEIFKQAIAEGLGEKDFSAILGSVRPN
jgi:3-hydroxyisobutyrate dehydrogenase